MLHPIKVPRCYPALEWVVQLQRDLLAKLCEPATKAAIVTPQWVAAIRPDCAAWLEKFARRSHKRTSLLSAMQTIASVSQSQKYGILRHFVNSQAFAESFDATVQSPTEFSPVQSLELDGIISCLSTLLEAFYEIALREGLPIDAQGNTGRSFDRSQFVTIFEEENYGRVCPLCDGDMNGPEVDHWLPKSVYPALSCHPKNLVPVCHRCNSRECKGEQCPTTAAKHCPFDDWFHPYERPAHTHFSVKLTGAQVSLVNADPDQQTRLNNLDGLLKLTPRWTEEYRLQATNYLKQLADKVRRKRIKPTSLEVLETVNEWLAEIEAEGTRMPHSIIRRTVLAQVNTSESPNFHAWLKEAEEALA
jgi:hypothetical protein